MQRASPRNCNFRRISSARPRTALNGGQKIPTCAALWTGSKVSSLRLSGRQRREQAARRLYLSAMGIDSGNGRFFDAKDSFGWYLFLAEAQLDYIENYDYVFGSRVIPIFIATGRSLHLLQDVEGLARRVQRVVSKERGQPNGGLLELLVAACYRRAGAHVAFVEEKPGQAQTHDMDVTLDGRVWAVECKRMEVGDYGSGQARCRVLTSIDPMNQCEPHARRSPTRLARRLIDRHLLPPPPFNGRPHRPHRSWNDLSH